MQLEQEETQKEYEPLIELLRGELGKEILNQIDFKQFQKQLLSILQLVLQKGSAIMSSDRSIIDQGLSLWMSCLVFNPELLEEVYKQEDICDIIIKNGLLVQDAAVRATFLDALQFICSQVKGQLSQQPTYFFLHLLLDRIDYCSALAKESKQYYQLLRALMAQYFQESGKLFFKKLFEPRDLLHNLITKLKNYEGKEEKTSIMEDFNLVGLLTMICSLIQNDTALIPGALEMGIVEEIMEKCLFTFDYPTFDNHIVKGVDLKALEKGKINKCHTSESREAAFEILEVLIQERPQLIDSLMKKYLVPLVSRVQTPKKSGFQPKTEGRSYFGYLGLKNLGAVCYMISMLQQFFHIPQFRYSILSAVDGTPPDLQEFEGDMVDDNVLH